MNIKEIVYVGFDNIFIHKLRSSLTILGIVFGVGAVIAMLSIGEGAKREILKQIEQMGMTNIILETKIPEQNESEQGRNVFGLRRSDVQSLLLPIDEILTVVPFRKLPIKVLYKDKRETSEVIGTTPDFQFAMNLFTDNGHFIKNSDNLDKRQVCVLGKEIKRKLFGFEKAVGKMIKLEHLWFTIIGTIGSKSYFESSKINYKSTDYNEVILIPISTLSRNLRGEDTFNYSLDKIIVNTSKEADIYQIQDIVARNLERKHQTKDYEIIIPDDLLKQSQQTQKIFNIVMGAIAGISLLVGGIGIMNIMLATVLERTKEIGIRLTVGAKQSDILNQFIIEAVMLSLFGGFVGIVFGYLLTYIITTYSGWETIISIKAIFLSFGVSTSVGLIFGIYPARIASKLNPIEAISYE